MGNYGIKISKSGVDVKTAAGEELIFTTKYSKLKVAKVGINNYTFASNPGAGCMTLGTIAHGFDYTPAHDSFIDYNSGTQYTHVPYFIYNMPLPGATTYEFTSYCDSTNIIFRLCRIDEYGGGPLDLTGVTVSFKYYIFADPGS